MKSKERPKFAICINNNGYKSSLEVGRLYRVIPDEDALAEGYMRIVDESGEDYGFEAKRFHIVELPLNVEETLLAEASALSLAR